MPRTPRCVSNAKYYHVMAQGHNKYYIFDKEDDIKYFIKLMNRFSSIYQIKIVSYCIMNNHYHILVHTSDVKNLSKYMHKVNTKYAIYFNLKYEKVGSVFRDRFKSEPIYNEKYYYNCIKYIYYNPVKANMCNNPYEYPYSNIRDYTKRNKRITDFIIDSSCEYIEIEEDKAKCGEVIEKYLETNQIKKEYLKVSKDKLMELLNILKDVHGFSYRIIESELGISRETLRKIKTN